MPVANTTGTGDSFGQKLGNSLLGILSLPGQLVGGVIQNMSSQAGYMQGNLGFGSKDSGDSGSWIQRNATIVIVGMVGFFVVLLVLVNGKKKK